jgi:hypothetical protein
MAHRASQGFYVESWQAKQRRYGYKDGLHGHDRGDTDQYYQRGLREGLAKRAGLHFTMKAQLFGDGSFRTLHEAFVGDKKVGEWAIGHSIPSVFGEWGTWGTYRVWRTAVLEGYVQRASRASTG